MSTQRVVDKLKELPKDPGVYFYKDSRGKIIYIGKAAVLRNRVRQYFQSPKRLDAKTKLLVADIADVEWITVASEIDALFLESEMIKRYLPKYNIDLRDDKHYQYVRINLKDTAPYVSFVRRPVDDNATYFGPFVQGLAMRQALKYLRRSFPYSTHMVLPKKVCLQYHLGLCPGLEEGKTTTQEYRANLKKLTMFLKGERTKLILQIEAEMKRAAKNHDYEQAAKLRDQARNLRSLSKQIIFGDEELFDISRDQALNGLSDLLGLNGIPRRIETYDISHIQGTNNVASMVVFVDGVPRKGEYRKFKMRLPGNDDFGHMRETMLRRFSGKNLERWHKPDLVVIDGGKGQLSAALQAMSKLQVSIPTIGLAKREEEIIRQNENGFEAIRLERGSHVLKLIQRTRDEAHRFAVTYHTLLRSKSSTLSMLDEIPGIGPNTRKKLIKRFGSLAGIKRASADQLRAVVGSAKAKLLEQYL